MAHRSHEWSGTHAQLKWAFADTQHFAVHGPVPTPYGDERMLIAAGTQSGAVVRLRGKGLPRLNGNGIGDLNVHVHVWTPDDLNDEQRRLFAELAQHEGEGPSRKGGFWTKLKEALGA